MSIISRLSVGKAILKHQIAKVLVAIRSVIINKVFTIRDAQIVDDSGNFMRINATKAASFVLFGLLMMMNVTAANAQGAVRSTHGAWSMVCDTPPGATSEQCALMQNVVAQDRAEVGLSVVVLRTADREAEIMRVLAPLGVLLPNGLGLNVDGKDIGRAYFVRCFQDGCYAEVILQGELLETLKAGKLATFIVFQTPEEGIGIPVDLSGFSDGFRQIP